MRIELPPAIAGYFAADRDRDAAALARHFAENAVVTDEGKLHTGLAAIEAWMRQSWQKYRATAVPFAMADGGGATVVTSHVEGDFPGSPIDLRYHFVLDGDAITALEITP